MAAKKIYPEDSLERASYLVANGILPESGRWIENQGSPFYRFEFPLTAKLGKLVLNYKASAVNDALTVFFSFYKARGKFIKAHLTRTPLDVESTDLVSVARNFKKYYGDA